MSETPASWQVEPHGRGRYTLSHADTRVRITLTRRGYRCSCQRRRCGHVAALEAWLEAQDSEEPPETRGVSEMPPEETTMPADDPHALPTLLEAIRAAIAEAEAEACPSDLSMRLGTLLARLRTLYAAGTGTPLPWPNEAPELGEPLGLG